MEGRAPKQRSFGFVRLKAIIGFESGQQQRTAAVEGIPGQWQADVTQVNPYLMGTICEGIAYQEAPTVEAFLDCDTGVGALAIFGVDMHSARARRMRSQFVGNIHLLLVWKALN